MSTKHKKILIVEDDMALKPLWESFFKKLKRPFQMSWSVSCEEAIKLLERENYDLIICDIFLAGSGTGIELLSSPQARSSQAKKVLISAVDKEAIIQEYQSAIGDAEVMTKPFNGKLYEPIITGLLSL